MRTLELRSRILVPLGFREFVERLDAGQPVNTVTLTSAPVCQHVNSKVLAMTRDEVGAAPGVFNSHFIRYFSLRVADVVGLGW